MQQNPPAPTKTQTIQSTPVAQPGAVEYGVLKAREKELKSQLSDTQDRRDELVQQANNQGGPSRAGIDQRITILDQRLVQIENDLTSVGRDLAATAPKSIATTPPVYRNLGYDYGDMVGAVFSGGGVVFALFIPFIIRNFIRRKRHPGTPVGQPSIAAERVDRMESAIDSIAVEIERVSENQRFMTRLLTETQLAGTLAAVRGSAEAAKIAAEESVNAK